MFQKRPLVLMILDGWGYSKSDEGNAFKAAKKPNIDFLIRNYPCSLLDSSGKSVGLPDGQMGNSEVGHLNIGAGRIVYQDLTLINESIKNDDFYNNNTLLEAVNHVRKKNSSLHLIGLVSDGGVHSHKNHLEALLKLAKREGIENVFIHAFLDGRDVSPTSGLNDIAELEEFCKINNVGQIASITGRYYAMDRDRRWERTKLAYDALTKGNGSH
ncbi:2,3-bisphosphoglycerate-independent phosphoglycerate mutase, partial [Methanosalsum natronophilum]